MSYHRGGHSGAVAVSYSTSTMSPLSPSRRYSGNTGSGASVTSGTNESATSKYSNYRSSTPSSLGSDRNGGCYSSASNTGYRGSGYGSSATSDTFGRTYYSPARSVSSYNESSSIVRSSSISDGALRYGSASSSSASSSAGSSNSSCTSRDRGTPQYRTPGSLATTAADIYALYSPTNYVPNIRGSASKCSSSVSHRRPFSSTSSSGISSSPLFESQGQDEYDSCRERRGRSYSSEGSSVTGPSSTDQNARSPINERWTTRRETAKRRVTPSSGVSSRGSNGHSSGSANKKEVGSSRIEVTPDPEETSRKSFDRRDDGLSPVTSNVPRDTVKNEDAPPHGDSEEQTRRRFVPTINDDNRDSDDNNADAISRNGSATDSRNSNDTRSANVPSDRSPGDTRRRRRRGPCPESAAASNGRIDLKSDANDKDVDGGRKNLTSLERNERVGTDDTEVRETGTNEPRTIEYSCVNDPHHQRKRHSERTSINDVDDRENDLNIPALSASSSRDSPDAAPSPLSSLALNSYAASVTPSSPISSDPKNRILTNGSRDERETAFEPAPAAAFSEKPLSIEEPDELENLKNSTASSYDCDVDNVGGVGGRVDASSGGVGGAADVVVAVVVVAGSSADANNHREALTRTKIPTNNDNTELLTNNDVQDREDHLGIVETTRKNARDARIEMVNDGSSGTKSQEERMLGGARKSFVRTATDETDDDDDYDGRFSLSNNKLLTNGDETKTEGINGLVTSVNNEDDAANLRVYDSRPRENPVASTILRNGVRSMVDRSDEMERASTSGRSHFGWNDPTIDDPSGASSSPSSSAATSSADSVPVAVHRNIYRGLNEQTDEISNSRAPRSRPQSRRDERYGLNGLRNIGNTCFMNSVIQCLSNTRPLLEYLLNEQHLQDINTTTSGMKGALIKAFGQVIQELWEVSGDHVINTTALKSQIQRFAPRFMGYSQQDAQEFLRYLLEGLHEDVNRVTLKPQPILTDIPDHYSDSHKAAESWKRYLRSEDSMIVDVFVGQLRSSLHCTACDHVSVTLDPFWDLSLPIPLRLGTVKLNQCLEHFTKVETLDGDEKPTCSKCQMRRKCTKSFSIQKFPKILVIHLKRFSPTERFRGKLSVLVDFPLTCLDLSAFAAPGVQGCTYDLYGVANHSGTTYSGHYTAYCEHPYSGEWHEYNDSRVSSVPARSVVSSEAYVLFYEQQPPSPHL